MSDPGHEQDDHRVSAEQSVDIAGGAMADDFADAMLCLRKSYEALIDLSSQVIDRIQRS